MTDKKQEPPAEEKELTEKTPQGYEVRTPKRGEFFKNLEKVSKPEK